MPTINFNTRASRYTYSSHLNDSFFVCSQNKLSRRILGVARAAWIRFLDHVIGLNSQRSIRSRFDIATIVSRYKGLAHDQLILKVTDDCNFRCSYCVYGGGYQGRERQTGKNMTIETAIEAVDKFLANHAPEHNISFYGGEPLLRLDLIKEVVEHARRTSPQGATPRFSLTSNGSFIDAETAIFLLENRFSLTLSMDGPSTIHDTENAKTPRGNPPTKASWIVSCFCIPWTKHSRILKYESLQYASARKMSKLHIPTFPVTPSCPISNLLLHFQFLERPALNFSSTTRRLPRIFTSNMPETRKAH